MKTLSTKTTWCVKFFMRDICERLSGCNLPQDQVKKCDAGHKILFAVKMFFGGYCTKIVRSIYDDNYYTKSGVHLFHS